MIPASIGEARMRAIIAIAAIGMLTLASPAAAQERAGSAALGALSGAIVLGPVGLVAGAVIGYAAGPEIGRTLRGKPASRAYPRSAKPRGARVATKSHRASARAEKPAAGVVTPAPGVGGPAPQGLE
jgi:hypothetical protein